MREVRVIAVQARETSPTRSKDMLYDYSLDMWSFGSSAVKSRVRFLGPSEGEPEHAKAKAAFQPAVLRHRTRCLPPWAVPGCLRRKLWAILESDPGSASERCPLKRGLARRLSRG